VDGRFSGQSAGGGGNDTEASVHAYGVFMTAVDSAAYSTVIGLRLSGLSASAILRRCMGQERRLRRHSPSAEKVIKAVGGELANRIAQEKGRPDGNALFLKVVLRAGLEPARITPHAPQTCAATNYATSAFSVKDLFLRRG
jgi:hypothetical protein